MIWTPKQKRIVRPSMAECQGLGLGLGFGGGASTSVFDPYSISGLTLDLNADVGVTESSGAVSAWANQGSAGGAFVQATGANKPTLNATAVNSKNGIVFDGSDDYMTSAIALTNVITTTTYTAFALMSYQSSTSADTSPYNFTPILNEPAGPYGALFACGGTELSAYVFDTGPHRATEPALDNAVHVNTQTWSAGTLTVQMGAGTLRSTPGLAAMSAGSGNCLLAADYNHTHFLGAKLRRLLVWNVSLSAPQIAQVYAYLAAF